MRREEGRHRLGCGCGLFHVLLYGSREREFKRVDSEAKPRKAKVLHVAIGQDLDSQIGQRAIHDIPVITFIISSILQNWESTTHKITMVDLLFCRDLLRSNKLA